MNGEVQHTHARPQTYHPRDRRDARRLLHLSHVLVPNLLVAKVRHASNMKERVIRIPNIARVPDERDVVLHGTQPLRTGVERM